MMIATHEKIWLANKNNFKSLIRPEQSLAIRDELVFDTGALPKQHLAVTASSAIPVAAMKASAISNCSTILCQMERMRQM